MAVPVPRRSGSWQELAAAWGPLYGEIFRIVGTTGTIAPLGDPYEGLPNASTFTGVRDNASGLAPTWTPTTALASLATAYTLNPLTDFQGVIPAIKLKGSASENITTPDAAGWTSALVAFSVSAWVNITTAGTNAIMSKYDLTTGVTKREWNFYTQGGGTNAISLDVWDETGASVIGRKGSAALATNTWLHVGATYNGGTVDTGIVLYVNGAAAADAANSSGVFTTMRDTAATVHIGSWTGASAVTAYWNGYIAGGPLGPLFWQGGAAGTAAQMANLYRVGRRALAL